MGTSIDPVVNSAVTASFEERTDGALWRPMARFAPAGDGAQLDKPIRCSTLSEASQLAEV